MKNYSWKRRLFLSYFFIGVVPLLVLGIFFCYGSSIYMKKEVEQSNFSMLSQTVQKLDYLRETMNSAVYHFSGTKMAEQLEEMRNREVAVDEGTVNSQLLTYAGMIGDENSRILNFLYLRGDKYIYTTDGRMEYRIFENDMKAYGDPDQASFFSAINSINRETTISLNDGAEKKKEMLYFLFPVPYMDHIPIATLGFGLDEDAMKNLFAACYSLDSSLYLFNGQYQNIFVQRASGISEQEGERMDELALTCRKMGGKISSQRIGGHEYVVMREISANSGLMLISVTEKRAFYQFDTSFATMYVLLILALVVTGVWLSLILSRRNFKPVQKLFDRVMDEEMGRASAGRNNEFEMISSRWDDIVSKNEELNALINRQRPMVKASCLRQILKGRFKTGEELEAALKSAAISLNYRYSFVIMLPVPGDGAYDQEKSYRILAMLAEEAHPHMHIYGLDILMDDGIAVIVNCQDREAGKEKKDIRLVVAQHLYQELAARCGIEIPFYVGRIYESAMEIVRSFVEATAIAERFRISGDQKIFLFEELAGEEQNMSYPILEQAVYIQCLKQANEEAALQALDNMIREIEPLKSFVITQCLCFDIINIAIRTLDSMKGFELKNVDLKRICTFASLTEFQERAAELTVEICRQYAAFKNRQSNELKAGILNYVNQHFGDSSMSLESVADEFSVSVNYLGKFFKQETGCSYIQYVTMIRMDRAKELLVNSDKQVKDIVAEIGYIDVANFVRKFKNYEGITPGQYREKMRRGLEG